MSPSFKPFNDLIVPLLPILIGEDQKIGVLICFTWASNKSTDMNSHNKAKEELDSFIPFP